MDCRGLLRAVLFFLIATIERFGSRHISIVTHGDRLPNEFTLVREIAREPTGNRGGHA